MFYLLVQRKVTQVRELVDIDFWPSILQILSRVSNERHRLSLCLFTIRLTQKSKYYDFEPVSGSLLNVILKLLSKISLPRKEQMFLNTASLGKRIHSTLMLNYFKLKSFHLFLREVIKKRIFYGQADHKRLPTHPPLTVSF